VGVFVSPVGYSASVAPSWRTLLDLNPLTGVIDAFRWCLLSDGQPFDLRGISFSIAISLVLTLSGLRYFRRMERTFADII